MSTRRDWLRRLLGGAAGGLTWLRQAEAASGAEAVVGDGPGEAARSASASASAGAASDDDGIRRGRLLQFPRDHGAHPASQIEWWYLTGFLMAGDSTSVTHGFQVTFFRSRTGLAEALPGRFAPRQILFAHAALTELARGGAPASHRHEQRIARWDGHTAVPTAHASLADTDVAINRWTLQRPPAGGYRTQVESASGDGFALDLALASTQPLLLQGDRGFSRKGPLESQASHYYSQPQLAISGSLRSGRRSAPVRGTAWLDHEWSDSLLPPEAEGWDWIGMNLLDGAALTAFRLRRPAAGAASSAAARGVDAGAVWAGGSYRPAGGALRVFGAQEVLFEPGRSWVSNATGARYPVEWRVRTPAGVFAVRSLLDGQELDGSASTGTVYWEGLAELQDTSGRRVGLGYLEMTGYASRLQLGRLASGPVSEA